MKLLSLSLIAMLSVIVAGCDGDGDDTTTTTTTTETTTEETQTTATIASGSDTFHFSGDPEDDRVLSSFSVFETGMLEARVEWSTGPLKLDIILFHSGSGAAEYAFNVESPATVLTEVTQDLLDAGNGWQLLIDTDIASEVTVNFIVRFSPD